MSADKPSNTVIGSVPASLLLGATVEWCCNAAQPFAPDARRTVYGLRTAQEITDSNVSKAEEARWVAARPGVMSMSMLVELELRRGRVVSVFFDRLHAAEDDGRLWKIELSKARLIALREGVTP